MKVIVLGPKGTGKSTILKQLFGKSSHGLGVDE